MIELISWLRNLEQSALYFYSAAAEKFTDNPHLQSLLKELATDEGFHYNTLGDAAELIKNLNLSDQFDLIKLEKSFIEKIQKPLDQATHKLINNQFREKDLLYTMIEFESSEANDFFMHIAGKCKQYSKLFERAVSEIGHHKSRILEFLESLPEEDRPSNFASLPASLKNHLLLIEEDPDSAVLYSKILSRFVNVTIARNETSELERIIGKHFDVIVHDLEHTEKSSFKMYIRALKSDPSLRERLIIITHHSNILVEELGKEFAVPVLYKPPEFLELKSLINKITSQKEDNKK